MIKQAIKYKKQLVINGYLFEKIFKKIKNKTNFATISKGCLFCNRLRLYPQPDQGNACGGK